MADINQNAAWVTARLTELGNATDDGLNTLVTDANIANYNAKGVTDVVGITKGGTGANNATDALANLGAISESDVAEVGKTGDYDDLINKPTIPAVTDTYDSTSHDGMSGIAVASAISDAMGDVFSGSIGDAFDATAAYSAGDYCIYNNTLYVFTADKAAGAWDSAVVEATTLSDVVKENTSDIADIEADIYKPGDITWADYETNEYPLGWSSGYWNSNTGAAGNNSSYIRTIKANAGAKIDWSMVDHFTAIAPAGLAIKVTECEGDGTFCVTHGNADSTAADATHSITVQVTDPTHFYLFTVGKQANLFDNVDAAFVATIELYTYINKADAVNKALYDIVADEYDPTKTYAVGDYCLYDLALYQCNTEITVAEAFNSAHWTQINVADRLPTKVENGVLVIGDAAVGEASGLHGMTVLGGNYELVPEAFANLAEEYDPTATYMIGDLCLYDRVLHRCKTAIPTPEAWDSTHWEEKNVEELLELKANTDGYYEEMAVGSAEQLISTVFIEDSEPYNFRKTGGSANVGNREYDTVVGGSVFWNQTINRNNSDRSYTDNGVTITDNRDGTYTVSTDAGGATATTTRSITAASITQGHRCYFAPSPVGSNASTYFWYVSSVTRYSYEGGNIYGGDIGVDGGQVNIRVVKGTIITTPVTFAPQMIDLTVALGPTIADYIYELETANAGAGVAYFKKYFPKEIYAYSETSLESVNTSAHEMIGFNQWDEEWEVGIINATTGENEAASTTIRSKNYIPVFPNTAYYYHGAGGFGVRYYDYNKTFISSANVNNTVATTPNTCAYVRFNMKAAYGNVYKNDICINLSGNGERDGEYEPYQKHTYPLQPVELRGLFKLDSANRLYANGDIYKYDGTVTRRYNIVDLGTLDWVLAETSTGQQFRASLAQAKPASGQSTISNIICAKYVTVSYANLPNVDKSICRYFASKNGINVHDSAYTDAATFKTAMSGVMLVYELATPVIEQATPYTHLQTCEDYGTERYVDYAYTQGTRSVEIPVGHNTEYMATNLRNKLQSLPEPSSMGDGQYLIQQTSDQMSLSTYIPPTPTEQTTTDTITIAAGGYEIIQFDDIVDIPFNKVISSEIELDSSQGDYAPLVPYILAYSVSPTDESKCIGVVYIIHNVGEQDALVDYIIHFRYWLN